MPAYYNEIEPYAAQWLRNLIKSGHIADGEVDTRSIVDVRPADLAGFTQAHFFAGIGGWSHALRLAGWPDDRPIWTGSCPCQPFSVAGKGAGIDDPRHLWPHFFRLIAAVRPPVVMGEQVAGAAGYGWLDGVRADLEAEGYASRGVDIPACAVDAPHIRSRLYWIASDLGDASNAGSQGWIRGRQDQERETEQRHLGRDGSAYGSSHMANADNAQRGPHAEGRCDDDDGQNTRREEETSGRQLGGSTDHDVADADSPAQQRGRGELPAEEGPEAGRFDLGSRGSGSFWEGAVWLTGADGKSRRAQPGIPLLAYGIPNRVGKLRAYGNAIVAPLAKEVIMAFMEAEKRWQATHTKEQASV
jgi:DNA (cytosine-5)-methyltransferase 1